MYKNLNLDCFQEIKAETEKYLETIWDFRSEKIIRIPRDNKIFNTLEKELTHKEFPPILGCSIFARGKNNTQVIHCDCMPDGDKCHSGIIIPIVGTEGSKFQWFPSETETIKLQTPDRKSYFYKAVFESTPEPIAELEIIQPIIAKIDVPHRAIASSNSPRAVLSIKFVGNPVLI